MSDILPIGIAIIGLCLGIYGLIYFHVKAYREGVLWLVACLVLGPIGYITFLCVHPKKALPPLLIIFIALCIDGFAYSLNPELFDNELY